MDYKIRLHRGGMMGRAEKETETIVLFLWRYLMYVDSHVVFFYLVGLGTLDNL